MNYHIYKRFKKHALNYYLLLVFDFRQYFHQLYRFSNLLYSINYYHVNLNCVYLLEYMLRRGRLFEQLVCCIDLVVWGTATVCATSIYRSN